MASIDSETVPAATDPPATTEPTFGELLWDLAARVYIRVMVILTLYVLSIGPLYWYWHASRYANGDPFFAKLYFPLEILCALWPGFGDWIDWYVNLWIT